MIGKVINERYKLEEKLGEGGMALVFKAKDLLLDRWVALKILRPQLVSDKDFVHRFHREARAVARLSHPNVVNIFDIGQDGGIHYLVMENIQGENLKEKIEEVGILDPGEALDIALQICQALVVAHRNNIVHCDIKPHNILITSEGGVKVTDFGIARAVNSATLAQTETVIGTAHYFSPEQARGGTINARSDLYSLGVVLYEMLTGQVPFRGDSPISVALKHINDDPLPPSQLNEKLPKRIDKLVMKALAKDPEKRFADASEMLTALQAMIKTFKSNVSLPEAIYVDNDQTQVMTAIGENQMEPEGEKTKPSRRSRRKEKPANKSVAVKIILSLTLLIVVVAGLVLGVFWALEKYTQVPVLEVPNFVGKSEEGALDLAKEKGFRIVFNDIQISSPDIPAGHVASQDIEPGKQVKKNRVIQLTLSKGATMTRVPDLIGKSMREVEIALHSADLVLGKTDYQFTDKIAKGEVITQTPPGNEEVKSGSKVEVILSKGPQPVMGAVPNLVGLTRDEAKRRLTEANFMIGTIAEEKTSRYPEGLVAQQEPAAGTEMSEGTPVNLLISSGLNNPKNLPVQSFNANIRVLEGPYEQRIQVIISDENGREVIYDKVHHPEDYITISNIYTVGPAVLQVYNNGTLVKEERYGF